MQIVCIGRFLQEDMLVHFVYISIPKSPPFKITRMRESEKKVVRAGGGVEAVAASGVSKGNHL